MPETGARKFVEVLWVFALVAIAIAIAAPAASAQVKPGDVITPDDAQKVQDIVSPGVYYKISHGMSMKVV